MRQVSPPQSPERPGTCGGPAASLQPGGAGLVRPGGSIAWRAVTAPADPPVHSLPHSAACPQPLADREAGLARSWRSCSDGDAPAAAVPAGA
jgi:hypothetical protein